MRAAATGCIALTLLLLTGCLHPTRVARSVLHAAGNRLVDPAGATIRLLGVDRSGTEYACIQGWGIFDGPSDTASIHAIAGWRANTVRVPLNEDCWLGINGVPPAYSGANYQSAVEGYVQRLHAAGLYAVLVLHWSAPGSHAATTQAAMPDADHSPAFWSSVAGAFRSAPNVVFDLFNEPFPDREAAADPWSCWVGGCVLTDAFGEWQTAGMRQLLDSVRHAGANQLVLLSGIDYANDLSGWLAHEPSDPAHNLAAAWHSYPSTSCSDQACWDGQVKPVAAAVPVITAELGDSVCAPPVYAQKLLPYLDGHGISYIGWTWDAWVQCSNVLIVNYSGMPAPNYGTYFHDHLQAATG